MHIICNGINLHEVNVTNTIAYCRLFINSLDLLEKSWPTLITSYSLQ